MKRLLAALACSLLAASAFAQVTVQEPWVRATVTAQKVTGAFMQLTAARDMKLVGVRSPVAGRAEIHEMFMDVDIMKMRQVPAIALPAGKPVNLAPGGYHVMLFDLKQEMKVGDSVPLTLVLEGGNGARETLDVKAQVRPLGGGKGHHGQQAGPEQKAGPGHHHQH